LLGGNGRCGGAFPAIALGGGNRPGGGLLVDARRRDLDVEASGFQRRKDFLAAEVVRFRDLVNPLLSH